MLQKKDLKEFRTRLELFFGETERFEPTNEAQVKGFKDRIVVLDATSKSYKKLLEIHTNQINKFKHNRKKKMSEG